MAPPLIGPEDTLTIVSSHTGSASREGSGHLRTLFFRLSGDELDVDSFSEAGQQEVSVEDFQNKTRGSHLHVREVQDLLTFEQFEAFEVCSFRMTSMN